MRIIIILIPIITKIKMNSNNNKIIIIWVSTSGSVGSYIKIVFHVVYICVYMYIYIYVYTYPSNPMPHPPQVPRTAPSLTPNSEVGICWMLFGLLELLQSFAQKFLCGFCVFRQILWMCMRMQLSW